MRGSTTFFVITVIWLTIGKYQYRYPFRHTNRHTYRHTNRHTHRLFRTRITSKQNQHHSERKGIFPMKGNKYSSQGGANRCPYFFNKPIRADDRFTDRFIHRFPACQKDWGSKSTAATHKCVSERDTCTECPWIYQQHHNRKERTQFFYLLSPFLRKSFKMQQK